MAIFPNDTDIVLVAILPSPKDLDIARMLGWYRIPLKSAPKVIAVDYVAFYQTGAFGSENKWIIRYIAPVKGHELTLREDLFREEPNHPRAKEEYYKIQIGALIGLNQPILADKWRRITFFYTTGQMIKTAASVRDLIVSGEERYILWNRLRERLHQDPMAAVEEEDFSAWNLTFLKLLSEWEEVK